MKYLLQQLSEKRVDKEIIDSNEKTLGLKGKERLVLGVIIQPIQFLENQETPFLGAVPPAATFPQR